MLTFQQGNGDNIRVMLGRKCIGFVMPFTISGETAWRYLHRSEPDSRFPAPTPKHATREAAVAYVKERMAQ